ncbi:MAG: hypothetical protein ACKOTZ_11800 [Chloroflexota bacterium]
MPHAPRVRRSTGVAALVLSLMAATGSAVAADPDDAAPAGLYETAYAWSVLRDPTPIAGLAIPAIDRMNGGRQVTVTRQGVGAYRITYVGLGSLVFSFDPPNLGIVMVTPIGKQTRLCEASNPGYGPAGIDLYYDVACHDRSGAPADTAFVSGWTYMNSVAPDGVVAAYAQNEVVNGTGTPEVDEQYSSGTGVLGSERVGEGIYRVTAPGVDTYDGVMLVGPQPTAQTARCAADGWSADGSGLTMDTWCRGAGGVLTNAAYRFIYLRGTGMNGFAARPAAHLRTYDASASGYRAPAFHRWSSSGKAPWIVRTARGRYTVTLRGLPKGGAAWVGARGTGTVLCQLAGLRNGSAPPRADVICRDTTGATADATFSLVWTK